MRISRLLTKLFLLTLITGITILANNSNDSCTACGCDDLAPKTFFTPRQVTFDPTMELALNNWLFYHTGTPDNNDCAGTYFFSIDPFYMKSLSSCDSEDGNIAGHFLGCGIEGFKLREDGTGDVGSLWVELISPTGESYESHVCIDPQRTAGGAYLQFYGRWYDCVWLSITSALMGVSHNLHFKEQYVVANNGTIPDIVNACDAFNNISWTFGKWSCCKKNKVGLDDIQIKLGYNFLQCDNGSHWGIYGVGSIPTSKGPKSHFMFEPLVGSKHGSLGAGTNIDFTLMFGQFPMSFMVDLKYRYIFSATEPRSFDLINGGLSRYLAVATEATPYVSQPGINSMTRDVSVTPGSTIDLWYASHYNCSDNWDFEWGTVVWWKTCESICLSETCTDDTVGIYDLGAITSLTAISASTAEISNGLPDNPPVSDTVFTPISNSDFNIDSAQHPSTFTFKLYGAVAYNTDCYCWPITAGIGAGYEWADNDHALQQWHFWATLTTNF